MSLLGVTAKLSGAALIPPSAFAAEQGFAEPIPPERGKMADLARAFMRDYNVPGLSVCIGRAGVLLYRDAFGFADRGRRQSLNPEHRFRIASVSKPLTSAAIFSLVDKGHLRLSDRVFGAGAIFGAQYGPVGPGVGAITVEHLLTHTCGGWSNEHDDPMFLNEGLSHSQLIAWTLRHRNLDHIPGQHFAYSNFGYCLLGRVIEKITGKSYARYVADAILKPCGIGGMSIAGNRLSERQHNEVIYYGQGENPYDLNVARMDSHGGWIAAPSDLVKFSMHVSGFPLPPNILKAETIRIMTMGSKANPGYAKGWAINKYDNWWHNGSLAGTSTLAVRAHSGFCWAAFTNTRRPHSNLDGDLDGLVWNMARQVKGWRV